jgi:hypothetical protein
MGGRIMVSDGIKAARIQAQCSPLIGNTWAPSAFPVTNVVSAIKNAAGLLNSDQASQKQAIGRHAGPVKSRGLNSRHVPRHAA